jgi:hypothetical protein
MEDDDSDDDLWDPAGRANSKPDASVTPELFKTWRSPRFGLSNPERMNNPVWEWLVRCRVSAYWANKEFEGPHSSEAGPCWCFRRFGQSKTKLPDGRVVLIGGEHEDFYDPDFYIYNDVVVRHPDGGIEIYGYPEEVFAPTDSHSATLLDDCIVVVGCLGYPQMRKYGTTPVYRLDLRSFSIRAMDCTGEAPGWLHKHDAAYVPQENAIVFTGGLVERGDPDRPGLVENIDDWKLHLAERRWERLTRRGWKRWDIRSIDGAANELSSINSAHMFKDWTNKGGQEIFEMHMESLEENLGFRPDLALYEKLYAPPVPHEAIPDKEGEFQVRRINVNGVVVRYNEDMWAVRVTVEGDLPTSVTDTIVSDFVNKLSALEQKPFESIRL